MPSRRGNMTRVGFSMPNSILMKVDGYAEGLGITRASALNILVSQALEYKDAMGFVGAVPGIMEKLDAIQRGKTEPLLLT